MDLNVKKLSSGEHSVLNLPDNIFLTEYNEPLVHQIVTSYMAAARQGTKAQKTRSEVSGGGAKPWKQKGTGRARAGTLRSPIFRKGGVTFAAKTTNYSKKINRKMYRAAIRSILSELIRSNRLTCLDKINIKSHKTREFTADLRKYDLENSLIIVSSKELSQDLYLASRNVKNIGVHDAQKINPVSLIRFERVVATESALKQIEEILR